MRKSVAMLASVLHYDHISTTTAIGAVTASQGAPFEVRNLIVEDPRDDEIVVRIVASGICHTEVSAQNQVIPFPLPALLGHEGAGVVERVGRNVSNLHEGDHVVVSFNFCGECAQCITGRPVQCDTWPFGSEVSVDVLDAIHDMDTGATIKPVLLMPESD
jgi:Zn-dependent alcohol dehydrogenase